MDENTRAQYDVRARNIISSIITLEEFYMIFVCKSVKEMWEVLRVTYEGTNEVKHGRKNLLVQEYKMF